MKRFSIALGLTILFFLYNVTPVKADYIDDILSDCYIDTIPPSGMSPVVIQPGGQVELWLISPTSLRYTDFVISAKNLNTGIVRNIPYTSPDPATNTGIDLGDYTDPGIYEVKATSHVGNDLCVLNAAFTVQDSTSTVKLTAPVSPITSKITTLPELKITGLQAGHIYNIQLPNWKGHDLAQCEDSESCSPRNDWTADSSGVIDARNICNNGQANRTNCTETFGDQTYGISISEKGGSFIASFSFVIDTSGGGGGVGSNPCINNNCETAIGNLPIGLKGLANRILQIGIGLAGGIALILIVIGSIRVLISSGDQQKLNGGREMIIAAIAGLLFLIFSTLILEFIGVNILGGVAGI